MRAGVQLAGVVLGMGATGCGSVTASMAESGGTPTPAPSAVQLDCPDGTRSAGHVDGVDVVKSTATPQELGDMFAAGREGDQNVAAQVVAESETEAVVAIAREDGTVNTILRLNHSDKYGWRMDSIVSCGHSQ